MSTITIENLSGGIGTAAFIAYLSSLCNIRFSAFQYAIFTLIFNKLLQNYEI